jgi:hypothetical protein
MTPFDCYKTYLAIKNHFTKPSYDYFRYCGKLKVTEKSFNKRTDRYFFEKMSRKKSDREIQEFFLSNFVESPISEFPWIKEIIDSGEKHFLSWKSRNEKLTYNFKQEIDDLFSEYEFEKVFECMLGKHPILLKEHMINKISIETMIILDNILHYIKDFDATMDDPIWDSYSMKIQKYKSFLNIDYKHYKIILREKITNG